MILLDLIRKSRSNLQQALAFAVNDKQADIPDKIQIRIAVDLFRRYGDTICLSFKQQQEILSWSALFTNARQANSLGGRL